MKFERWGLERPVDMATLEPGTLVAGRLDDEPFVGLLVSDGDGHGVVLLSGGGEDSQQFFAITQFDQLSAVDGRVIIACSDDEVPFLSSASRGDHAVGLIMGDDGKVGLRVMYRQSIARRGHLLFDLETGRPWAWKHHHFVVPHWKLLVWPEGRREPYVVGEYGGIFDAG